MHTSTFFRPTALGIAGLFLALLAGCAVSPRRSEVPEQSAPPPIWTEAVTSGVRFLYCRYRDAAMSGTPRQVAFWSDMSTGQPWLTRRGVEPGGGFTLIPVIGSGCPRNLRALKVVVQDALLVEGSLPRILPPPGDAPLLDPDGLWADWKTLTTTTAPEYWSMSGALHQLSDQHDRSLAALVERIQHSRDARLAEALAKVPPPPEEVERRSARTLKVLDQILAAARSRYDRRAPAPAIEEALRPYKQARDILLLHGVRAS